jgi:hypothetical protein
MFMLYIEVLGCQTEGHFIKPFLARGEANELAGPGGHCEDSTRYCGQYPREGIQESFNWWQMGGWNPRGGMPFRGDSNTHTIETPRSRAHIKAEISRLENNFFGCLGKLVNSIDSNCYLTALLMMPLLTGV